MNEQPVPENPYASPTAPTSAHQGPDTFAATIWGEGRVAFSFQHSVEDYIAVHIYLSNLVRSPKRQIIATLVCLGIGILILVPTVGTIFTSSPPPSGPRVSFLSALFFGIFFLVIGYSLLPRTRRRQIARSVAKMVMIDPELWLSQKRFTIGPDGLGIVLPHADSLLRWCLIEAVAETDAHIFFLRKLTIQASIPKRVFSGAEETNRVMRLVQSYLKPLEPRLP